MINAIFFVILIFTAVRGHASSYMIGDYEEVGYDQKSFMVAYPNPALTPGDTVPATRETVCSSGYSKRMRRNLSKADKAAIYSRYGLPYDSKHYQIDHFIPLSIGGSNDQKNLWPQPIEKNVGFIEKQQVADFLHRQVCSDAIDIHEAQEMIRKDWHAAFIKIHGGKLK